MKKYFVTGLVILLPLVITVAVVMFLINFLTKPFMGVVAVILTKLKLINHGFLFLTPEQVLIYGSKLVILILLFLITVALGMIARWFLINTLFRLGDKILHRIPLVNTVYKTTQDIIKTLFVTDKNTFKQVVMVPFPRPGVFVLGLISRESPNACCKAANEDLISVFVPTTPNPTTGFLLMFKPSDLIHVEMKPEDAIKYIVSCGVIIPNQPSTPLATT
ncbi:MAG: DUF502 domain-containing protein [Chlamydiota bacterium]